MDIQRKDDAVTAQGRDTPGPVGEVGAGTGHHRPSPHDCPVPPVGFQAGVQRKDTGAQDSPGWQINSSSIFEEETPKWGEEELEARRREEERVFGRRDSIRRSPIRRAVEINIENTSDSNPEVFSTEKDDRETALTLRSTKKRKAKNIPEKEATELLDTNDFNTVVQKIGQLAKFARENRNVHKEVKSMA